jgi:hypothetical protein
MQQDYHGKVMDITPDIARAMLLRNLNNRAISDRTVSKYARDMASSSWLLTYEPIIVGKDETLLNGQHRLSACIRANVKFKAFVVFNAEKRVQNVIDTGKTRSTGDALRFIGEKDVGNLSACLRYIYSIKEKGTYRVPSNSEIAALLLRHPNVRESLSAAKKHINPVLQPSILACVHYIGGNILGRPDLAEAYARVMSSGVPTYTGDPVHIFRELCIKEKASLKRDIIVHGRRKFAGAIHAWNLFARGAKVKQMRIPDAAKFDGLDRNNI